MQGYSVLNTIEPATPRKGAEFDEFLFAPIGTEQNGMPLSVLSALARMNLDPRHEAESLAQLSGSAATHKLALLIADLPAGSLVRDESETVAARLIKLLPQQNRLSLPLPSQSSTRFPVLNFVLGARTALRSKKAFYVIMLLIALVLTANWFAAS